ncbi:ATP-binding protein [Pseudoduganella sp. LjRoot289]|uniref:sensor histidine kinase n=1 Tax=Pseudoduganella sp. LjRoot289 TaxID=3342314 RepID=UPI003ED09BD7
MVPHELPATTPPTILVVDDSPSFLTALLDHLASRGFLVLIARTAEEGLMRAEFGRPDLILMDVVLPAMDGFEACRRLKARDDTKDIPLIFMTSLSDARQKVIGFAAGGVDYITKPFQIEEVLARINTHLELRKANRDLQQMFEQLTRAKEELVHNEKLAALGALVAGISHELNTPIGNSLMIASAFEDQTSEFRAQFGKGEPMRRSVLEGYLSNANTAVEVLVRNLHRAADMVSNFKQVAVDQTSAQRRTFLLAEVVSGNVLTLLPTIRRTPYTVTQEIPPTLMMDSYPGPLGQVITNLVANAITHGLDGRPYGTIAIASGNEDQDQDNVVMTVSDDGKGISADNLLHIYEPFFTTKLGVGGSGLGLHIVHNIVSDILGGRIDVHSTPGTGTTFTLTLPLTAPMRAA